MKACLSPVKELGDLEPWAPTPFSPFLSEGEWGGGTGALSALRRDSGVLQNSLRTNGLDDL